MASVQQFISRRSSCTSNSRQKAGRPEGGTWRVVCEQPVIETTKALNRQSISRIETSKLDPFVLEGQFFVSEGMNRVGWEKVY